MPYGMVPRTNGLFKTKKGLLLSFIIIGSTVYMCNQCPNPEHRRSKCFDNLPWRTLRMTLREAVFPFFFFLSNLFFQTKLETCEFNRVPGFILLLKPTDLTVWWSYEPLNLTSLAFKLWFHVRHWDRLGTLGKTRRHWERLEDTGKD